MFVRKVRAASGAVAVQVMRKVGRLTSLLSTSVLRIPMLNWVFCWSEPDRHE